MSNFYLYIKLTKSETIVTIMCLSLVIRRYYYRVLKVSYDKRKSGLKNNFKSKVMFIWVSLSNVNEKI